jgi:DNA-binding MarR family transcriptional regulator
MTRLSPKGRVFTDVIVEVFRTKVAMLDAAERLTRPVGLTSARWQVLGVVEHEPAPVAHIARIVGLTRQSVQQTADAMEQDGLIKYRENPHHRRAKLVAITPKARAALDYLRPRQLAWANLMGGRQTLDALQAALAVLRRTREDIEKGAEETR